MSDAEIRATIRKEQVIGGTAAVTVVLLEIFLKEVLDLRLNDPLFYVFLFFILLSLYILVTQVIGHIVHRQLFKEKERQEAYMREPIAFKFVGIVNGVWVDAIWEGDKLIQVSVIDIRSSRAEGIAISGDSFRCHCDGQGNATVEQPAIGHFRGSGSPLENATVHIAYTGGEQGQTDWGGLTYRFRLEAGSEEENLEAERYFDGDFLARTSNSRRYVLGKKIRPSQLSNFRNDRAAFLKTFLSSELVRQYRQAQTP